MRHDMVKTKQYFKYKYYNDYKGAYDDSGYLVVPDEVEYFKKLVNELGFTYEKAFERITGRDSTRTKDLTLIVEYVKA
jgi:hypothetical protein